MIDKDFLKRHDIRLSFKLLNKLPLYNYARFIKKLCLGSLFSFEKMIDGRVSDKVNCFKKALIDFTLDYSSTIKELTITPLTDLECTWVVKHHRFEHCFRDLYKLDCNYCNLSHENS